MRAHRGGHPALRPRHGRRHASPRRAADQRARDFSFARGLLRRQEEPSPASSTRGSRGDIFAARGSAAPPSATIRSCSARAQDQPERSRLRLRPAQVRFYSPWSGAKASPGDTVDVEEPRPRSSTPSIRLQNLRPQQPQQGTSDVPTCSRRTPSDHRSCWPWPACPRRHVAAGPLSRRSSGAQASLQEADSCSTGAVSTPTAADGRAATSSRPASAASAAIT